MSDNKISNEQDAEKLNLELEALTKKWMLRGERVAEVALALQRASIVLFVGHGFTPKFLVAIVKMGAESSRRTINEIQQERDDADLLTVSKWKDADEFSANSQ